MSTPFHLIAAYTKGRAAFLARAGTDTNPYPRDCLQYWSWRDGWIDEALTDALEPGRD